MKNKWFVIVTLIMAIGLMAREHESHETLKKSYSFKGDGKTKMLIINNLYGDIKVTGHAKQTVDVVIQKTIWARSAEQFELAKSEVTLDVMEEEDLIEFFVNGPFREKNHDNHWCGKRYKVMYHFDMKVPFHTGLELETINDGDIIISNVHGPCSANNINGGIDASGIREVGRIYALNEHVQIRFDQNPTKDCTIGSLNGDVRLYFKKNLSADFQIDTFNGEVYSDFEVEHLEEESFVEIEKDGKCKYKTGHHDKIRVGKGGPEIFWKGFNGDLLILDSSLKKHTSS